VNREKLKKDQEGEGISEKEKLTLQHANNTMWEKHITVVNPFEL
jgi:hypothetical protein